MDLYLTEEQVAIRAAVEQLVERHPLTTAYSAAPVLTEVGLEKELLASDFLNVARVEGLGEAEALIVIEGIARSPFAVELTASALVLPSLDLDIADRPVALVRQPYAAPVRFLSRDGVALVDAGEAVRLVSADALSVTPVDSLYGYPMGRIGLADLSEAGAALDVEPEAFRRLWRLGVTAEIVGAMQAALDLTVEHVKTRQQFGQPLGAFQVIQQRLAECAVLVLGARTLMYEAAAIGGAEDAAFAASYAQDAANRLIYDTHQFHGAMGLTLEYPLHYWTYRLRVLAGELGGVGANGCAGAELAWPLDKPIGDFFRGQEI